MPSAGFEPTIPASKRPQTLALDRGSSHHHHYHHHCEPVVETEVGGAWGLLERGRRDAQRYYGGKPAARDHRDRQSSNYAVRISSKTILNLVRKFEENTPRVAPHNSKCNF